MTKKFFVYVLQDNNIRGYRSYLLDIDEQTSIFENDINKFLDNKEIGLTRIIIVTEAEIQHKYTEYNSRLETSDFILLGDFTRGVNANSYKLFKQYIDINKISYEKVVIVTSCKYEFDLLNTIFVEEPKPTYASALGSQLIGVNEVLNKQIKKRFIYLNRNQNRFRLLSFVDLMRRGVLDNSFYSFFHIKNLYRDWNVGEHILYSMQEFDNMMQHSLCEIVNTAWKKEIHDFWEEIKYDFYNKLPFTLSGELEEKGHKLVGEQVITDSLHNAYNNSYMSLLVETHMSLNNSHFQATEKSYKACYYRHPFLVYSTKHWLKRYKLEGYQTFSDYLDESYDDIENPYERIFVINEQVDYLNNLNNQDFKKLMYKMNKITLHNYAMAVELLSSAKNVLVSTKNDDLVNSLIRKEYPLNWY